VFQLAANKTSVRTEVLAGLTTYLTMAYIVVVNPAILAPSGIDPGGRLLPPALRPRSGPRRWVCSPICRWRWRLAWG
jgi:adenine/guanine/hypoxanthine permease